MDDETWLLDLYERIWPKERPNKHFVDVSPISQGELIQLSEIIERSDYVVQLWTYGPMFGIGLDLLRHEQYFGTGPECLFRMMDDHVPKYSRTWYERVLGEAAPEVKSRGKGCIRQDVWDLFSRFSHTEQNREWLQKYGLKMHFEPHSYDY